MPVFNHIIIFWHVSKDGLTAPWHYLSDSTPTQLKRIQLILEINLEVFTGLEIFWSSVSSQPCRTTHLPSKSFCSNSIHSSRSYLQHSHVGAHKFSQFPFLPSWFSVSTLVLHPSIRLSYFEDKSKWDPSIAIRARVLLEHLYEIYKEDGPVSDTAAPHAQNPAPSVFMDAIKIVAPSLSRAVTEIEAFFSGTYPCTDGNALKWWKVRARSTIYF